MTPPDSRAPDTPSPEAERAPEASALRDRLEAIWREILVLDRAIDDRESFFEIGGHSLAASLVLFELGVETGIEYPVRLFFRNPRLGDLADALAAYDPAEEPVENPGDGEAAEAASEGAEPAVPVRADGAVPLSWQQRQLWLIDRLEGPSAQYTLPLTLRFDGPIEPDRLAAAFARVVARHDALRTVYRLDGDEPVQIVTEATVTPPIVDLSDADPSAAERAASAERAAMAGTVFALDAGPPLAARLIRLGPERHELLIAVHHIAFDGWSADILVEALATAYDAEGGDAEGSETGAIAAEAEPAPSYLDHTRAEAERLAGPRGAALDAFWRDYLAEADEPGDPLPDRPGGLGRRGPAAVVRDSLDGAAAEAAKTLATACDTTLFTVLFALYGRLVGLHAGRDRVVLGTPMANRTTRAATRAIGYYANSLALTASARGDLTARDLMAETAAGIQEAFAHQDMPFARVVERLNPPRAAGRNPIFNTVFVLQHKPAVQGRVGEATVGAAPVDQAVAKFDLILNVLVRDDRVVLEFEYDTALFDADRIAALAAQYRHLVAAAAAEPDRPLGELDILPDCQAAPTRAAFDALAEPPGHASVAAAFRAAAAAHPETPAVIAEEGAFAYAALDAWTDRLAAGLAHAGVAPGDRVAVALPRGAGAIAAYLACAKAGAIYLPLAVADPPEHLAALLASAEPRLVLAEDAALAERLRAATDGAVTLRGLDGLARTDAAPPAAPEDRDHPLYVMYTSGSTGVPKGCLVAQDGVLRLALQADYVTPAPGMRVLHASAVAFDAATFEIYVPLLAGGTVVVHPDGPFDPDAVLETVARHRVDTMWLTAGAIEGLAARRAPLPGSLATLLTGGDVLPPAAIRRLMERHPGLAIVNGYGPTENTTFTCCDRIPATFDGERPLPVGRPIRGTAVAILDGEGRALGPGMPGELVAYGLGVGLGYLGRPDLTTARFGTDPATGWRFYRTGDLARWRADGRIDFLGRRDGLVKIRGFRIEIGAVEAALARAPGVEAAAVTVHGDAAAEKVLVGWIQGPARPEAVAEAIADTLPGPMRPARLLSVEALPLNRNGKVDRTALAAGFTDAAAASRAAGGDDPESPPEGPVETAIADLWVEVLGLPGRPDATRGFFDLGGHSLAAMRLSARLSTAFDRDVPLRAVIEHTTIREQARLLGEAAVAPSGAGAAEIAGVTRLADAPGGPDGGPASDAVPTVCLAGIGGQAAAFLALAATLPDAARPVLAIEPPGAGPGEAMPETVEAIVAGVLGRLSEAVPDGPVRLVGHSFGGRLAFEAARRLAAEGRDVSLVLLDALPGNDPVDVRAPGFDLDPEGVAGWLVAAAGLAVPEGASARAVLESSGMVAPDRVDRLIALTRAQVAANAAYDAGSARFEGPARLVFAERSLIGRAPAEAVRAALARACPGAEAVAVPGDHFSMLRDGAALAAACGLSVENGKQYSTARAR
ncbi:MAG: amino acid adenylation domain-containing protein [Azospirillaceae bacterium]